MAATVLIAAAGCSGYETSGNDASSSDSSAASKEARTAYSKAKAEGVDLTAGPCLAERLPDSKLGDWVVDIAHDPRTPADERPENQCARLRSGEAHHFVELDPEGNVLRVS